MAQGRRARQGGVERRRKPGIVVDLCIKDSACVCVCIIWDIDLF